MFTGLPDFGRPGRPGGAEGFAAYEQPGAVCTLPGALRAEPLVIDQYLQERDGGIAWFTLVHAAFAVVDDAGASSRARPAPLGSGQVRLVAPAAVGLPAAAAAPQPCDAATGVVLPMLVRLDGVAGTLLVGAVRGGLQTLGAVLLATVRGVAVRCPGTLTVDADALRRGIGPGPVRPDHLLERAVAGLPGVTVTGGPADQHLQATAVVDRIVARLAAPVFLDARTEADDGSAGAAQLPAGGSAAPGDATQGGWLFAPDDRGHATLSWDLDEPVEAVRLVRLACDPVLGGSDVAPVVREHEVPSLSDGREQLLVHSTLPGLPAGVVMTSAKLTAPAAPPARPFETEVSAALRPPSPTAVTLHLAAGEPLVYDLQGVTVLDTDHGPRTVRGAVRRVTADTTPVVTPADLGLRLVPVHATRGLTELAEVTVTVRATRWVRDPAVFVSTVTLAEESEDAWVAVPRDAAQVTVRAAATTRGSPSRTVTRLVPDAAVWLDPFSFTDPPWDVEPEPEEEEMLVVEAGGLRAAGPKGGPDWRFLPLAAGPVRGASGQPQVTLVEAGGLAMLMVTTALEVSDAAQDAVRTAALAAGAADDVRLSPAPFRVEGSAELLVTRDGHPQPLATSATSATVSQDAVFSAGLSTADLEVVRRALAGEAGLLTVRYLLRVTATGPLAEALSSGSDPVPVVTDASTWRA